MGWERSSFGYPRTDEFCGLRNGGCGQHFQYRNGSIYWSPASGAHPVEGKIKGAWADLGWEKRWLGYPTSGEYKQDGLVFQNFEGGWLSWNGKEVHGEGWRTDSRTTPQTYGDPSAHELAKARSAVKPQ